MKIVTLLLTVLFSIISTSVMAYISLATPIGPWIAPTLVLIGLLICKFFFITQSTTLHSVALATAGGSIGGIIATAFGFSFPTLFFLDGITFNSWLSSPIYFALVLGGLSCAAGGFAYYIAGILEEKLLLQDQLAFPVGQLTYKLLNAGNNIRKAYELTAGIATSLFFCFCQDGFYVFEGMGRTMSLIPPYALGFFYIPALRLQLDTLPMLVSIGFITGNIIALPLAVGALSKIVLIDPINSYFFSYLKSEHFLLAFCSGIVIVGAMQSFAELPKLIHALPEIIKRRWNAGITNTVSINVATTGLFGFIIFFLSWFNFSIISQLYLLVGTFLCVSHILVIAGKMGIAPLGRFATFVMVPALLLFGLDAVKVTIIATFVEVCCGVAVDLFFNRKMGELASIDRGELRNYQLLGLLVSSCTIGIIFWLLIHHFSLGSELLIAQRAQARALLVQAYQFDWYVVLCGMSFGWCLKKFSINAVMVLGGLLMAPNISLALIIGGSLALLVKNREDWEPFWSGVFTANSIVELVKTIL